MAMTDKEIMSAAARLRAAKRRTSEKACAVCGTSFEGIATRRFCSDRCRVRAAREVGGDAAGSEREIPGAHEDAGLIAARRELDRVGMDRRSGEGISAYFERVRAYICQGRVLDDSTELIRQSRIERTNDLMRAGGHDDWIEEA